VVSLLLITAASAQQTTERWTIHTVSDAQHNTTKRRGETRVLEVTHLDNNTGLNLSGVTNVYYAYRSADMTNTAYVTNGYIVNATGGTYAVRLTTAMETVTNDLRYEFYAVGPSGTIARTFGKLWLQDTMISATPTTNPATIASIDWASTISLNNDSAPFALKSNTNVTTVTAGTNVTVSETITGNTHNFTVNADAAPVGDWWTNQPSTASTWLTNAHDGTTKIPATDDGTNWYFKTDGGGAGGGGTNTLAEVLAQGNQGSNNLLGIYLLGATGIVAEAGPFMLRSDGTGTVTEMTFTPNKTKDPFRAASLSLYDHDNGNGADAELKSGTNGAIKFICRAADGTEGPTLDMQPGAVGGARFKLEGGAVDLDGEEIRNVSWGVGVPLIPGTPSNFMFGGDALSWHFTNSVFPQYADVDAAGQSFPYMEFDDQVSYPCGKHGFYLPIGSKTNYTTYIPGFIQGDTTGTVGVLIYASTGLQAEELTTSAAIEITTGGRGTNTMLAIPWSHAHATNISHTLLMSWCIAGTDDVGSHTGRTYAAGSWTVGGL